VLLLVILAGAATGIVLGLFGSGGSIIAMPALMLLLDVEAKSAIAMSLGIVAVTATLSAWDHWRRGNVNVRVATVFGLFGIIGTFAGAKLGVLTPVVVQLVLFALVMYAAAWKMLKPALVPQFAAVGGVPPTVVEVRMGHIAAHGIGVGLLTGVVGVGGGFLIVPALVGLGGLPVALAVGTSLWIIALNAFAGFVRYLPLLAAQGLRLDWTVLVPFIVVGSAGSVVGHGIGRRLPQAALKRIFGVALLALGTYVLVRSAGRLLS
jgi:hypothetical protein